MPQPNTLATSRPRIVWIDQLRSIAFLLVIIGHVAIPKEAQSLIYSFHMPLFFLISGLTVNRDKLIAMPVKDYVIKQFKALVIPYFWMCMVSYPLWYLAFHILSESKDSVLTVFIGSLYGNAIVYKSTSNALWFVLVLFCANILYQLLLKLTRGNEGVLCAAVGVCGVIGFLDKGIPQPWHINVAFTAVVLLYLGNCFMMLYKRRGYADVPKNGRYALKVIGLVLLFAAVGAGSHLLNGRISMTANKYGASVVLFYITALAFSLVITLIMIQIPKLRLITYIGQNTLLYVGIHLPILRVIEKAWPQFKEYRLSIPLAFVLYFGIALIVLFCNKFVPFVNGKHTVGHTRYHVVFRVLCVAWCGLVPCYAVMNKLGFSIYSAPFAVAFTVALLLLSTAFVLLTGRFAPVIYLEDVRS